MVLNYFLVVPLQVFKVGLLQVSIGSFIRTAKQNLTVISAPKSLVKFKNRSSNPHHLRKNITLSFGI